ncbi:MAG: polyhydroxyalkanoate synthesis repressor PhaR, partial [Gammaproteobacteria bacterium]
MPTDNSQPAKLIKKYANRRLYDTEKSRYITLADLTVLAREQISFVVEDARSGENITRQILVQIISDHEQKEETSMMSVDALREVVSLYVPSPINQMFIDYLGNALANFMRQQSGLQRHMDGLFAEFAPPSTS